MLVASKSGLLLGGTEGMLVPGSATPGGGEVGQEGRNTRMTCWGPEEGEGRAHTSGGRGSERPVRGGSLGSFYPRGALWVGVRGLVLTKLAASSGTLVDT